MSHTYPISLVLAHKAVLVVGGGEVATRKVKGLLACDVLVTVVSPEVTQELKQLASLGQFQWLQRRYESSDLDGTTLVFVCTDDSGLNTRISQEATQRQLLVNVADAPELCSFYLPSVLRRGMLSIAVSTEGSSPLTARRIREDLETQFDDAIGRYLELLQSWRPKVTATLSEDARLLFWQRASDGSVYGLMQESKREQAEELLSALYKELLGQEQ